MTSWTGLCNSRTASAFSWLWLCTSGGDCLPYINPVTSLTFSCWEITCVCACVYGKEKERGSTRSSSDHLAQQIACQCLCYKNFQAVPVMRSSVSCTTYSSPMCRGGQQHKLHETPDETSPYEYFAWCNMWNMGIVCPHSFTVQSAAVTCSRLSHDSRKSAGEKANQTVQQITENRWKGNLFGWMNMVLLTEAEACTERALRIIVLFSSEMAVRPQRPTWPLWSARDSSLQLQLLKVRIQLGFAKISRNEKKKKNTCNSGSKKTQLFIDSNTYVFRICK